MELIESFFEGPVLPATFLLLLMLAWNLLAILGAFDLDMPADVDLDLDLDLDVDADIDASSGAAGSAAAADSLGILAMRWLNLREVPILIWLGVFSLSWWFISVVCWRFLESAFFEQPSYLWSALLVVKNLAVAIPATKLLTNPMRGWFTTERLDNRSLIGKECSISSLQATPEFGQVRFKTDGAPLLLNVRTDGGHLSKGTRVWITHYDPKKHIYIVSPTGTDGETSVSEREELQ